MYELCTSSEERYDMIFDKGITIVSPGKQMVTFEECVYPGEEESLPVFVSDIGGVITGRAEFAVPITIIEEDPAYVNELMDLFVNMDKGDKEVEDVEDVVIKIMDGIEDFIIDSGVWKTEQGMQLISDPLRWQSMIRESILCK